MQNIVCSIAVLEQTAQIGEPELIAFSWVPPASGLASFTHQGRLYQQPPERRRDRWLACVKPEIAANSPGRAFVWLDYDDRRTTK